MQGETENNHETVRQGFRRPGRGMRNALRCLFASQRRFDATWNSPDSLEYSAIWTGLNVSSFGLQEETLGQAGG
jgi:hypothetical protein